MASFGKRKLDAENDETLEFGCLPIRIKTEFDEVQTYKEVSYLKMSELNCMDSVFLGENNSSSDLADTSLKPDGYLWTKGPKLVEEVRIMTQFINLFRSPN